MSRCLELAGAMLALSALAGCASFSTKLGNRALLGGYKIMDAPTSEVPIGARWQQGYGPVGPGAAAENIVTRRSFSSLTLSRAARRGLEIRMAEYIGLQPGSSAKLSASVSEISVSSVKDSAKLGYQPGDAFLSDAMKASKITITTESQAEAELVAGLQARGLRVASQGTAEGQETLTVEGVDLFFAYRVVRLERNEAGGASLGRVLKRPHAPGW
jgi:hypothetical protein